VNVYEDLLLDLFLKSLVPTISKHVASMILEIEEEVTSKDQQFELIYTQSRYLYYILPYFPSLQ